MERSISNTDDRFRNFKDGLDKITEDESRFNDEIWFRAVELLNFTSRIIKTPDSILMSELEGIRNQVLNNPNNFSKQEQLSKLLKPIEKNNISNFRSKTKEDIA